RKISFADQVIANELEVGVVDDPNHAAAFLALISKIGGEAGSDAGKPPVDRHGQAPRVDEFYFGVAGVENRDRLHAVVGFDEFERQRHPVFYTGIIERFELFRQISYHQTMKHHRVTHIGEIFHPVEIVVISNVTVHQFKFAVRTSEDIDLG